MLFASYALATCTQRAPNCEEDRQQCATCDLVQLLIKLGQLCALSHDVLAHEEGRHDWHGPPLICAVQSKLYEGLIQEHPFIPEVEPSATCCARDCVKPQAILGTAR